jgi:peptidoglycan/LPS O-acetylase OafA/YrhL
MELGVVRSGASKKELRADIQALRGFAVLAVVLFHAGVSAVPAGYLGVDVFFVISGFLITGLIAKGIEANSFSFASFYLRRAKRLLPAAYVVLVLTLLAAPFLVTELVLEELRMQVVGAVTFTSNFVLWQQSGYFDGAAEGKPLLHFWSLSLEEQYYLLMPAMLAFTPRRAWLAMIGFILVVSAGLCAYVLTIDSAAAFYLLPTRAWQLALGSLGALLAARVSGSTILSWARLPALLALFAIPAFPLGERSPGLDSAIVCVATLILIVGGRGGRIESALPVRAFAWVGNFSYSLYLVHWPVLVLLRAAWSGPLPSWLLWSAIAACVAISLLLYWLVEEPFRRGFLKRRVVLGAGLAAASIAVIGAGLYVTEPRRQSSAFAASESADPLANANFRRIFRNNLGIGRECVTREQRFSDLSDACRTRPEPKVILWGDSNAMMWGAPLARQLGDIGVVQAVKPRCAPMYGMITASDQDDEEERRFLVSCLEFNDEVFEFIRDTPSIETVIISSTFSLPARRGEHGVMLTRENGRIVESPLRTTDASVQSYVRLGEDLRALGKRIVIIGPPPRIPRDPAECHERHIRGQLALNENWDCQIAETEWREVRGRFLTFLDEVQVAAGIEIIWPSDFLCVDGVCRTRIGDVLVYRDAGHISYSGADLIADEMELSARLLQSAQ